MWWLSSLFAVLLLPVTGNAGCDDGPTNCTFQNGFCGWEHPNWNRNTTVENRYAKLRNNKQSGDIKSKMRCVSPDIFHCMKFRFYLENSDYNILTVSIERSENTEELLWTYSNKTNFTTASVPIKSDSDFFLIFRARREADNNEQIRVDDFKYEQSGCKIEPSSAAPPQAATTEDPMTTTTTSTLTKSTEKTTLLPKTSTAELDTNTAVNTSASSGITDAVTSSDTTGTIVGAVFGAIAVALVAIIVFIVLHRKQSPLLTLCFPKKKKDAQQQSGSNNRAFHSESPHDTELDDSNRAPTYANTFNDSASMVNPDVSTNHYSVIRDVGTDDVTSSAFQPGISLYCNARVLQSTHKEDEDSKSEVPSTYANQYDVVGDELGICQARVSSKAVEYKNLTVGKSHQTGASSDRTESSNSKSEDSSYACNRAQSATHDDTVYQNTKECSQSQPAIVHDADMKRTEVKKGGKGGEEMASEGDYYNVENTTATYHGPDATCTYHILEEDPQSGQEETQTGSVYHVLEPDPLATEPSKRTIGLYHILEDTETNNLNENPVASKASSHSHTFLSEGGKGDYNMLDFQKGRGRDVVGDSGDEMDQTYSHLNEAGQDTYSELSREKKREVVDGDYSHVTLD